MSKPYLTDLRFYCATKMWTKRGVCEPEGWLARWARLLAHCSGHTAKQRAEAVREQLIGQLEGVAADLKRMLEAARESEGRPPRCTACVSFIPGVSKLKLGDILAVIRELRAVLPAQHEHEGLPPIQVNVVSGCQVVPNRPAEE